jgi:DEAD/DEAH box helicase domain-containing protein
VANPKEHAENLLEKEVVLIDESGRPGRETFVLYNPPIVNRSSASASRAHACAQDRLHLIANKIQTIVFTTSRLNVEVSPSTSRTGSGGRSRAGTTT